MPHEGSGVPEHEVMAAGPPPPDQEGELAYQQWLEALGRLVDGEAVLRRGLASARPGDATLLEEQIAEDRKKVLCFMQARPWLHKMLQEMLASATCAGKPCVGKQAPQDPSTCTTVCCRSSGGEGDPSTRSTSGGSASTVNCGAAGSSSTGAPSAARQRPPGSGGAGGAGARAASRATVAEARSAGQVPRSLAVKAERGASVAALILCRQWTTLAVYNVAPRATQVRLVEDWPVDGSYDFLRLCHTNSTVGRIKVVYINFLTPELAAAFHARWQGRALPHGSKQPLQIAAAPVQGRDPNVMLTPNGARTPPLIVIGEERLREEESLTMVRLAKSGVFVATI